MPIFAQYSLNIHRQYTPNNSGKIKDCAQKWVQPFVVLTVTLPCGNQLGASMAPVGHTSAHDPHSMHVSASITYWVSPAEIADTGHTGSHVPHDTQESVIT